MQMNKVSLSEDVTGVLGDSARVKYDENGEPILEAHDKDGAGILDHPVEFYEVDSLLSTDKVVSSSKMSSSLVAGVDLE